MPNSMTPTQQAYLQLQEAFNYFNESLFQGRLPQSLIIHARKGRTYGYYCPERWQGSGSHKDQIVDEIALNPQHFRTRSLEEVLSTLAHEMVHQEQHHFGKPSRTGYHNKEWGNMMKAIGLHPSNTGEPGGTETGQQMTHYIIKGGPFDNAVSELVAKGFSLTWSDIVQEDVDEQLRQNPRKKTKWKFTCPECGQLTWGKSDLMVKCGRDDALMVSYELEALQAEAC